MKVTVFEMTVFSMLGALMYASKVLMEVLPNVHLIGVFIVAETIVYRKKALYPTYIFVFLTGLFNGFATWWLPYLYIWTVLWGVSLLIPQKLSDKKLMLVSAVVCSLHGFLFGTLYAPVQAILFGLDFKGMITWIVAGLPYDAMHGISNLVCGFLIVPLIKILKQSQKFVRG
ncbi:MAG TPA: hypothetical protein DDY98_03630 [Ruminococcaceae bacterium]|nr:hypothetical protein [Oscillospiraceae bacterium]